MEPVSSLVKKTIPHYLENLPIPNTFGGWFRLGFKDWLSLIPLGAAVGGLGYMTYRAFCPEARRGHCGKINPKIHKENAKHVDVVDIESIGDKAAFCRCWRSEKWPYCDGIHGKYNREFRDNVGPLKIVRNAESQ